MRLRHSTHAQCVIWESFLPRDTMLARYNLKFHGSSFSRSILVTSSRGCHKDATRKTVPWNLSYIYAVVMYRSVCVCVCVCPVTHRYCVKTAISIFMIPQLTPHDSPGTLVVCSQTNRPSVCPSKPKHLWFLPDLVLTS